MRLVLESQFHEDGGAEDADLHDIERWTELGPECPSEKQRVVLLNLQESKEKGMSKTRCQYLKVLFGAFSDAINLKPDAGKSEDIERLRIRLKSSEIPVR